ncbi:hypothetical protein MASR2M78_25800 [Treponema sp.]
MADISTALASGNYESIRASTHRLYGTLANFRMDSCSPIAEKMELAAAEAKLIEYTSLYSSLQSAILLVRTQLGLAPTSTSHATVATSECATASARAEDPASADIATGTATNTDELAFLLGPEEDSFPELLSQIATLDGIDVERGLLLLGNDHDLYEDMLITFAKNYAHFDIHELVEKKDFKEAQRIIHGLKGAASSVGFFAIEETARGLEEKLKKNKGLASGEPGLDLLISSLGAIVALVTDHVSNVTDIMGELVN